MKHTTTHNLGRGAARACRLGRCRLRSISSSRARLPPAVTRARPSPGQRPLTRPPQSSQAETAAASATPKPLPGPAIRRRGVPHGWQVTAQFAGQTFQNNLTVPAGDIGNYNFGSSYVLNGYSGFGDQRDYYLPFDVGQSIDDSSGNEVQLRELFWYATASATGGVLPRHDQRRVLRTNHRPVRGAATVWLPRLHRRPNWDGLQFSLHPQ